MPFHFVCVQGGVSADSERERKGEEEEDVSGFLPPLCDVAVSV